MMSIKLKVVIIFAALFTVVYQSSADISFKELDIDEELASHMVELQVLTHKLGLSIDAKNPALISFYLHESTIKLNEMQRLFPEYEGTPVALYIDRLALPIYEALKKDYSKGVKTEDDFIRLKKSYAEVLNSCNLCHVSSGRPEIQIIHNAFNPYLQDFSFQPTKNQTNE